MKDENCIFCKIAAGEIPLQHYTRMMTSELFWTSSQLRKDMH